MRYLVIVLLFMFSCSQVQRVGDEPSDNWFTEIDKQVKTKKNVKPKEEPKVIVDVPKAIGYELIDCGKTSRYCVKKIKINTSNKFGIIRVWIEYSQYPNDELMSTAWKIYSRVYVATKDDDEDVWFGYKDVDIDDIEEGKEELLEEAEEEMKKTIKKILSKPLKNE